MLVLCTTALPSSFELHYYIVAMDHDLSVFEARHFRQPYQCPATSDSLSAQNPQWAGGSFLSDTALPGNVYLYFQSPADYGECSGYTNNASPAKLFTIALDGMSPGLARVTISGDSVATRSASAAGVQEFSVIENSTAQSNGALLYGIADSILGEIQRVVNNYIDPTMHSQGLVSAAILSRIDPDADSSLLAWYDEIEKTPLAGQQMTPLEFAYLAIVSVKEPTSVRFPNGGRSIKRASIPGNAQWTVAGRRYPGTAQAAKAHSLPLWKGPIRIH